MAQRFVLKDRSRDADGRKERSHMIRDPKQKMAGKELDILRDKEDKDKLVKTKKGKSTKIMSLVDTKPKRSATKRLAPPKKTKSSKS